MTSDARPPGSRGHKSDLTGSQQCRPLNQVNNRPEGFNTQKKSSSCKDSVNMWSCATALLPKLSLPPHLSRDTSGIRLKSPTTMESKFGNL